MPDKRSSNKPDKEPDPSAASDKPPSAASDKPTVARAGQPADEKPNPDPVDTTMTEQQKQSAAAAQTDAARAEAETIARQANAPFAPSALGTVLPVKVPRTLAHYLRAESKDEATVTMVVPVQAHGGPLKIRLEDHSIVEIPPGVVEIPKSLVGHWY